MPQTDTLRVDLHAGVQTLTLNQPRRLNALGVATWQGLLDAVRAAERDPAVRAVVVTGAESAFSSGADTTEFDLGDGGAPDLGDLLRRHVNPVVARLRGLEKPVLAAVNGVAAGAGVSLALACDLRFADEAARFVLAFVRIGLVPDAGLLYHLPRLVGPGKTLELAWTGDAISAQEALDLGLLNGVLPAGRVLGHTQALAERLARGPRRTLALIKRAVNQAHELSLERVLEVEAQYQTVASAAPEFAEGLRAFREKRPARFEGD